MSNSRDSGGRIITFYSYKGGTGRSMLLANVAWILASNGKKVLTLDWDLEAPGLHQYFRPYLVDPDLLASNGIIDMVIAFATAAVTPIKKGDQLADDWYLEYADISRYATSLEFEFRDAGTIDFVPAGRQNPAYAPRVNSFDWHQFYERLGGGSLLEAVKVRMRSEYDYILIDSRTGVSDTSSICTVQMPDDVVICFTLNNQSIEGASTIAESTRRLRGSLTDELDGSVGRIFPVPTRVEFFEKEKLERGRAYAKRRFSKFLWHIVKEEQELYWGHVEVTYWPYYAYEEILAVFGDKPGETNSLLASVERLTSYLTDRAVRGLIGVSEVEREREVETFLNHRSVALSNEAIEPALLPRKSSIKENLGDYVFVSYSGTDGLRYAEQLVDALEAGSPPVTTWLDVRALVPGEDWDVQLAEAARTCDKMLLLFTSGSSGETAPNKSEWLSALRYNKPLIPLRFGSAAVLPFRLSSRQYIDFTDSFDAGLRRLREHLNWLDSPQGVLEELRLRLADAELELPRSRDELQRARIERDVQELQARIAAQEDLVIEPKVAAARTTDRISTGLEGVRQPARPEPEMPARARFVNPPPMAAPTYFQDRHTETELLAGFLAEPEVRLVTVTGRGGVGKSALVSRLLKGLETGRLPDELGELAVDGIVYLRTASAHSVNFSNLFTDLCRLLPSEVAEPLLQRHREPHESPAGMMAALLEALPEGRSLVLLDNFEDLIDESGTVTDTELDEALRALLSAPTHGVKVIITTRVAPQSLLLYQPGAQRRIDLDEGLQSPYAEQLLRARDPDGRLGLKTAPEPDLGLLRVRTRGYPRALEAVVAILSADRDTSLAELLAETERLPDNVVEALVGEAFQRLDGLAQQVMQALAIFPVPVPPVAVDYVLQPFQPAINAAPVLTRLVNMQFVRRDAGHYYLHQVDRDYALGRVPAGQPTDRDADPAPFTQYTLWDRAADYFTQIQTPPQDWKTLDDLAPQLAEFELRYQGEDYDTAAQVLLTIDFDYLITWGHYRYVIDLHTRLQGRLTDPETAASSTASLGTCYYALGDYSRAIELHVQALVMYREVGDRQGEAAVLGRLGLCHYRLGDYQQAIDLYEQALTIAREIGDRAGEANHLGNLGLSYADLGQTQQAIELHQQALTIAREIGDRAGEATYLGNLGLGYADLGQTQQAIELHQQALTIAREIGDRAGEATYLGNLGLGYADLGQTQQAIELHQQALTIAREIGDRAGEAADLDSLGRRYADLGQTQQAIDLHKQALAIDREIGNRAGEASDLNNLGVCEADLGRWGAAVDDHRQAVEVADAIGNAQVQAEARHDLAWILLHAGDLPAAVHAAQDARDHPYPPAMAGIALIDGIIRLRQGEVPAAHQAFTEAIAYADQRLTTSSDDYDALDTKALALGGLTLTGPTDRTSDAAAAFSAARTITTAPGITNRVLRRLDILTPADPAGTLQPLKSAATGNRG